MLNIEIVLDPLPSSFHVVKLASTRGSCEHLSREDVKPVGILSWFQCL